MISSKAAGKNTLFIYDNISGAYRDLNSSDLVGGVYRTSFNELHTSQKHIILDIKSTYGINQLTDETGVNFGATIIENSGRLDLQTANQTGSNFYVSSLVRGVFQYGANGEAGISIKVIDPPTGLQYARWGYFDGENGAGFGLDVSGLFVFRLDNLEYSKVYRNNWNSNVLSGAGNVYSFNETQNSYNYSVNLDCDNLEYSINPINTINNRREKVLCHFWENSNALIDGNQPLRAEVFNGESVGQFKISIGDRYYGIIGGEAVVQRKPFVDSITDHTISVAQNVWEPIMAVRKKENFGPSNRNNSVNTKIHLFSAQTDQNAEFMITLNGSVTGTNWLSPEFRNSDESACEVQKVTNNALGISTTGQVIEKISALASNKGDTAVQDDEISYFGNGGQLIAYARRTSSNSTTISAQLHWDEEY